MITFFYGVIPVMTTFATFEENDFGFSRYFYKNPKQSCVIFSDQGMRVKHINLCSP
jgi:hypothetical protein